MTAKDLDLFQFRRPQQVARFMMRLLIESAAEENDGDQEKQNSKLILIINDENADDVGNLENSSFKSAGSAFFKKAGNFGSPSWRRFNIKNCIFWGSKRASNIKLIFKTFWHRFGVDFRRFGNIKNEIFAWEGCIFLGVRAL